MRVAGFLKLPKLHSTGREKLSPPVKTISQPLKSKSVPDLVKAMTLERIAKLLGLSVNEESVDFIEITHKALVRFTETNLTNHREWKTELDAWIDYRRSVR